MLVSSGDLLTNGMFDNYVLAKGNVARLVAIGKTVLQELITTGEAGKHMYFLVSGTLVYSRDDDELLAWEAVRGHGSFLFCGVIIRDLKRQLDESCDSSDLTSQP